MADRVHPSAAAAASAAKTINYILSSFRPLVHAVKYIFVPGPETTEWRRHKETLSPGMENSMLCCA
jgi:hypothetical protein